MPLSANIPLVCGLVSDEVGQRADLAGFRRRGPSHVKLNLFACAQAVLIGPLLVAGRIEEEEAENVDVPHPVDPSHEACGGGRLQVGRGPRRDAAVHVRLHDWGLRDVEHPHLRPHLPLCA